MVEIIIKNLPNSEKIFDVGFHLFHCSVDIVPTFEFCREIIMIWKMMIFNKVDYIEIEPALKHTII